jgi:hypothetical protein
MLRILALVALILSLFAAGGCQSGVTAPAAYKFANQARYNAVRPWLDDYSSLRPELAPRIADLANSWEREVQAQRAASTQPAQ